MGQQISLPSQMSVQSPGGNKPGEGVPRRLTSADPPKVGKFGKDIDNIYAMFLRTATAYPDNKCFGWRPTVGDGLGDFEWMTYFNVLQEVKKFAAGLATLGLPAKSNFGMYARIPARAAARAAARPHRRVLPAPCVAGTWPTLRTSSRPRSSLWRSW